MPGWQSSSLARRQGSAPELFTQVTSLCLGKLNSQAEFGMFTCMLLRHKGILRAPNTQEPTAMSFWVLSSLFMNYKLPENRPLFHGLIGAQGGTLQVEHLSNGTVRKTIKLKHECGFNSHSSHLKYIWGRKELKEEEIVLPTKHSFVGKQASPMRVPGLTSWLELQWLFFQRSPRAR